MGKTILIAVDDSPTSQNAALFGINLAKPGDEVRLIAVCPPPSYTMTPAAPIASAGAVAALSINWEQQRKADEERCRQMLHTLVQKLPEEKRDSLELHRHVLPAAGGASGVAESVVAFAKEHSADLVIAGSRGLGALKSTLMSLVGLGSVSSYLVHNMHCPVAICRGREQDAQPKAGRKVMVSLDDSETSRKALEWVVQNILCPEDELHLVCVALPIPYPVSAFVDNHLPQPDVKGWRRQQAAALHEAEAVARRSLRAAAPAAVAVAAAAVPPVPPLLAAPQTVVSLVGPDEPHTSPPLTPSEWEAEFKGSMQHTEQTAAAAVAYAAGPLQIVAEDAAASEVLEADEFEAATQDSIHYAREIVTKAVDEAAVQVDKKSIFFKALAPEGGASDVGQSIVRYATENGIDVVALGARGMGSWKRAIMTFVGLGSVSDYVVTHVECPVVVVKQ